MYTIDIQKDLSKSRGEPKGISIQNTKWTLGHFNPKELEDVAEVQGGHHFLDGTDIHSLEPLEKILKNKSVMKAILNQHEAHARGGKVGEMHENIERMRQAGRNGDTKVALIGPHTQKVLAHLMGGGPTLNPHTRAPEFFGFGDIFKSVKSVAKPFVQAALPVAQGYLAQRFPGIGEIGGQMLGSVAQNLGFGPDQPEEPQQEQGQMQPQQNFGGQMANYGRQFADQMMQGSGFNRQDFQNPRGLFDRFRNSTFGQGLYQHGIGGLMEGGRQALNQFMQNPRDFQGAMRQGLKAGAGKFRSGMGDVFNQMSQDQSGVTRGFGRAAQSMMRNPSNYRQAIGEGFMEGTRGSDNPFMRAGRAAYGQSRNRVGGPGDMMGAAMRGARRARRQVQPAVQQPYPQGFYEYGNYDVFGDRGQTQGAPQQAQQNPFDEYGNYDLFGNPGMAY